MKTISSYLATVLNTPQTSLTSAIPSSTNHNNNNTSLPIPSTPPSNPPIPTSTTLKSRHVRLNSSPLSSSSSEGTFDGSDGSASPSDLRSRCSSAGTETAGDDWTLGDLLLSQVEMEGADVAFRLGWLEDEDEDDAEESEDDSVADAGICVMAILPSIEGEDGQAPSRKRPLEDAAEGFRKCRRLADVTQPQHAGDAAREATAANQALRGETEGSKKRRRGGSAITHWDPVREAARQQRSPGDAVERPSNRMRLSFVTEASQTGETTAEATTVVRGWTAINHPPARFSARHLGV
ncbi:hypothetical protein LTR10_003668 [Elasticomyces elasticus]|nr:hypothetical protein LTR10_003668 [Elasticomyces elasticus]KAK4978141.1 hypothetical protein LTR42_002518 [Elasticomyces elasticus]